MKKVNAVVVGAGGGVAAKELATNGLSVVLLERGRRYTPYTDRKGDLRNQRTSILGNNSGPDDEGNPRVIVDVQGRERVVLPSQAGYSNNAACVGGGTLNYGAMAWRFNPKDFRMKSTYGAPEGSTLEDWPVSYDGALGCPRVMVNQGTLAPEVRQSAIATLKTIGEYGKSRKVAVTMENRGGGAPAGASWSVVVDVIKAAGIYTNPDIDNFLDDEARAAGLRAMYPLSSGSSHCHYDPEQYDEAKASQISKVMWYDGLYSIEASANNGLDPSQGG